MELGSRRFFGWGVITKIFSKIKKKRHYHDVSVLYNKDYCCSFHYTALSYIIKIKILYTPAVRSKILSKLIFASCVCDTPIARITGCVSSLRI